MARLTRLRVMTWITQIMGDGSYTSVMARGDGSDASEQIRTRANPSPNLNSHPGEYLNSDPGESESEFESGWLMWAGCRDTPLHSRRDSAHGTCRFQIGRFGNRAKRSVAAFLPAAPKIYTYIHTYIHIAGSTTPNRNAWAQRRFHRRSPARPPACNQLTHSRPIRVTGS
jgi:hypothetical protein